MRFLTLVLTSALIFNSTFCLAQNNGFETLTKAKTSMESIVKQYAACIPDTSIVFKKYYLLVSKQYNEAKVSYEGYRGAMKDCILSYNRESKIKDCLSKQTLNIKAHLDSLQSLLQRAYIDQYMYSSKRPDPTQTQTNTGLITGDFLKTIIGELVDAAIKIWDQSKKYQKQFKDDYLNNVQSKDYALSDFDDLLKAGREKPATK